MEEDTTKVAWNMGAELSFQIADLIKQATTADLNGDYKKYFFTLKIIRKMIADLSTKERATFKSMEKKMFSNPLPHIIYGKIEDYQELLFDCLDKYGYLTTKKEDSTRMF